MFVHGYLLLPDYIAIAILTGNLAFLASLTILALKNSLSTLLASHFKSKRRNKILAIRFGHQSL